MAILTLPALKTQLNTQINVNGVQAIGGGILNTNLIDLIDTVVNEASTGAFLPINGGTLTGALNMDQHNLEFNSNPANFIGWDVTDGRIDITNSNGNVKLESSNGATLLISDIISTNANGIIFLDNTPNISSLNIGLISSPVQWFLPGKSGDIALLSDIPAPDGNGLYSGSDTTPSSTQVSLTDTLVFGINNTMHISNNFIGISTSTKLASESFNVNGSSRFQGNLLVSSGSSINLAASGNTKIEGVGNKIEMTSIAGFKLIGLGTSSIEITRSSTIGNCIMLHDTDNFEIKQAGTSITTEFVRFGTNLLFTDIENNSVGVGTLTPDDSAILDVDSTTKGFLPPRMTGVQLLAITSPVDGLIIYATTTSGVITSIGFWGRENGAWVKL